MIIQACCQASWLRTRIRGGALLFAALIVLWGNAAAAQSFTLTLQPNNIPSGTNGVAYSQVITAVGGTGPYTFAVTSGSLPTGLILDSDGTLHGNPSAPSAGSFTITATDTGSASSGFRPYTFSIGTAGGLSVGISPASLPAGSQNVAYTTTTITASGGSGGYVFSLGSGSLPSGMTMSSGGVVSGTPTVGGSFPITVNVIDSNGNTGTKAYTVNIGTNSLTVHPNSLPNGTQFSPYSQTVSATGGTGPYTFVVSSGSLPAGLSLNGSTGDITGSPSGTGSSTFTIRATDSINNVGSRTYTVNIGTNSLTVNPSSLPAGTVGTVYNQNVTASGGTGGYTFAVTSGSMPTGLSLSSGGAITGTPTTAGTSSITITATDSSANIGSRTYSLTINLAALTINPSSLPAGTVGTAYSQTIVASGGSAPYSYTVLSGALPTGLALNGATGAITGTPSVGGSYGFTIQATDATPNTGTRAYTVNIGTNSLTVAPPSLPNGTQTLPYSQTITASGGTGPYTFVLTSGSLPAGLSLSSGGVISGTPGGSGTSTFTVQATDSLGNTGSSPSYSVNIGTSVLTVNPATLPSGTRGVSYSQTVSATGGTGPYTFAVSSGVLPTGLALNASTGVISGTPTGSGVQPSFTVRATDTLGNIGTRSYAMSIGTVSLTVNPATLPAAVVGKPYSQTVIATGGTAPYTYSVSVGALPPGLTLNASTGVISGTPSALGSSTFTIQALDVNGNTGSRAYSLTNRPDPALDPEVIGLINAQVAAARRFASAQADNVMRHMEGLHDRFEPCSFNVGVSLPPPTDIKDRPYPPPSGASPYSASPGAAARSYEPDPNSPAAQIARRSPTSPHCFDGGWVSSLAAWVSGSVEFGQVTPTGQVANNKFTTSGLTAGIDWRANDRLIFGLAVGFGADRTDVGVSGTRSDATSFSGTFYSSYKPFDPVFIDMALGYGTLGYDNHRWIADSSTIVSSTRNGSYWFGAVSGSLEAKFGALRLAPYLRADYMSARLNGYAEQGSSDELLTFGAMSFQTVSGTVGLRGSYDMPTVWGTLTPLARVEYRQAFDGSFQQSMYYSDLGPSITSVLDQGSAIRALVNSSVGLRARSVGGMTAQLEYGISSAAGSLQSQTVRGSLKLPF